ICLAQPTLNPQRPLEIDAIIAALAATSPGDISALSLHDALPIFAGVLLILQVFLVFGIPLWAVTALATVLTLFATVTAVVGTFVIGRLFLLALAPLVAATLLFASVRTIAITAVVVAASLAARTPIAATAIAT